MLPIFVVIPLLGNNDRLVFKFVFKIFEDTFGVIFFWLLLGNKERLATKKEVGNFGVASLFGNKDLLVTKFVLTDEDTLGVAVVVLFSRNFDCCKLAGVFFIVIAEPFSLCF